MPSCHICAEPLKLPVCLPCGHAFCSQCILVSTNTPVRRCPSCRSGYSVDMRPSRTNTESTRTPTPPSPRNEPPEPSSSSKAASLEIARLRAENHALRTHCSMWRKRAETHGEANLHLIKFASALRDQASQIARDRNELEQRCFLLKRQLDGEFEEPSGPVPLSGQKPPSAGSDTRKRRRTSDDSNKS